MKKRIPAIDLMFYLIETHHNPKHVGAVQIFQIPPDAGDDYMLRLVEKMRELPVLEPFNFKPVFPRTGMPQWQSDDNMEMEYHLRHSALPRPGSMSQLMAVAQRLHTGILDRERPGWICQIIEGLEGNRFALYYKIHHAYIDGMSAVVRIYGSLANDANSEEVAGFWSYEPEPVSGKKSRRESSAGLLRDAAKTAQSQIKAMADLNRQALKIGMELFRLREHSGHTPFQAPRTRLNEPVPSDLRSMGVATMPLDQLKKIGKAAGCTLNDVVLTIIDAALHDYLALHKEDPGQPLVAMCPMALRDEDDTSANTQATVLLIELGQRDVDLRERLDQVVTSSRRAKAGANKMSKEGLMNFAMLLFGGLEVFQATGLERLIPQSSNLLVSNVPGPDRGNMYLMGSRMKAIYPITTLGAGNNLMITLISHGNNLDFGVLAAQGTMPDIDYLVERMDVRCQELIKVLGVGAKAARKPRAKRNASS